MDYEFDDNTILLSRRNLCIIDVGHVPNLTSWELSSNHLIFVPPWSQNVSILKSEHNERIDWVFFTQRYLWIHLGESEQYRSKTNLYITTISPLLTIVRHWHFYKSHYTWDCATPTFNILNFTLFYLSELKLNIILHQNPSKLQKPS